MKPIINKLLFISMLLWTVCPEVFAQNDSVVNSNPVHRQSAPTNRFPKAKIEGERKDSVSIISIVVLTIYHTKAVIFRLKKASYGLKYVGRYHIVRLHHSGADFYALSLAARSVKR